MNPLLKAGDNLCVMPYGGRKIRRGDVIAFIPPGGQSKIIHRVISLDSPGIRARGDNNNRVDPWRLSPEHILGQVVYVRRGNRWRKVFGGRKGQLFAMAVRGIRVADSCVTSLLRPAYVRLARTGVFSRWLPAQIKTQVISYARPAGTELQLVIGGRLVGRKLSGKTRWDIRRPFRLFVDEASLSNLSVESRPPARHSRSGDGALSVVNQDNEVV